MNKGGTLNYLLADHLGSTATLLNSTGGVASEQRYYPFGRTRWGTDTAPTDKRYTGHQREGEFYFMKARFYDPLVGRFLQPDSVVPDPADPQALNRYSYVVNNPLRYTDPYGYWFHDTIGGFFTETVPGFFTDTLPSGVGTGFNVLWDYVQPVADPAAAWVASGSIALASAVWSSGPVEAMREYVADKEQDLAAFGWATLNNPSTLLQNSLVLGIALTSVGDRRWGVGGFVEYESCHGTCQIGFLMNRGVPYTPGFAGFAPALLSEAQFTHENQHGAQSQFFGILYAPALLEEWGRARISCGFGSKCLHDVSALEVDARAAETEGLHYPFSSREWP